MSDQEKVQEKVLEKVQEKVQGKVLEELNPHDVCTLSVPELKRRLEEKIAELEQAKKNIRKWRKESLQRKQEAASFTRLCRTSGLLFVV